MGVNLLARSSSQDKHFNSCFLSETHQQMVQRGGDYNLVTHPNISCFTFGEGQVSSSRLLIKDL